MIKTQDIALPGETLSKQIIFESLQSGLGSDLKQQKVLVLIPDHTRSLPLPFFFKTIVEILHNTKQLDFMVALGTHPTLSEEHLNRLVGIKKEERIKDFAKNGLFNHAWNNPNNLFSIGIIEQDQIKAIAGDLWHPSLPDHVDIRLNKTIFNYDHILIIGPTFPHEVVGFSGGAKYLFPGISGPEMINATHWLGALAGVVRTIGIKNTPARSMIHAAAARLSIPITVIALGIEGHEVSGIFIGDYLSAWSAAADFSAERNIRWCDKPYRRVLSCAPPMYDELWTAAKAMYKIEPAVGIGGEVIVYAPHLDTVSHVHEKYIYEVGYHILPYILANWDRYNHIPLGVLAHSTHLRGSGIMETDVEKPSIRVTLASKISAYDCNRLNLGYLNPDTVNLNDWKDREAEGILFVPRAGEMLYRVRERSEGLL